MQLHHVGLLVPDLMKAAHEQCDAFGYTVESGIIDDVRQTARVMFLRQPDARIRLELITPLGTGSKLSAGLAKGGGLHHLCYATRLPLEHALDELRVKGWYPVSDPAPAAAFGSRRIAWMLGTNNMLVELLEIGDGDLPLDSLAAVSSSRHG